MLDNFHNGPARQPCRSRRNLSKAALPSFGNLIFPDRLRKPQQGIVQSIWCRRRRGDVPFCGKPSYPTVLHSCGTGRDIVKATQQVARERAALDLFSNDMVVCQNEVRCDQNLGSECPPFHPTHATLQCHQIGNPATEINERGSFTNKTLEALGLRRPCWPDRIQQSERYPQACHLRVLRPFCFDCLYELIQPSSGTKLVQKLKNLRLIICRRGYMIIQPLIEAITQKQSEFVGVERIKYRLAQSPQLQTI